MEDITELDNFIVENGYHYEDSLPIDICENLKETAAHIDSALSLSEFDPTCDVIQVDKDTRIRVTEGLIYSEILLEKKGEKSLRYPVIWKDDIVELKRLLYLNAHYITRKTLYVVIYYGLEVRKKLLE